MKLEGPWIRAFGSFLGAWAADALFRTIDLRAVYVDPTYDPGHPDCPHNVLVVLWHEYLLSPVWARRKHDITMLVSRHRDAQWLSAIGRRWGYDIVEGSSNKGGAAAVREILTLADKRLAMTPDGPRGPRRTLATGPIWLASRQKRPLVPVGIGCDRPWRLNSWDRFAIPRPGSRVRMMFGEPIRLPPRLNDEQLEAARGWIEGYLNQLTASAEAWAESGEDELGGCSMRPRIMPDWFVREDVFQPPRDDVSTEPASPPASPARRAKAA